MIGNTTAKEQTIFGHAGNIIKTEDRDVRIVAKYEEPLVVVLGNVLSDRECDELIEHARDDVEGGGETAFPMLNLSVFPNKGMAVYFEYFYSNHELNELTLHAGTPVIQGEK